jgi:hypothetical protein
VCWSLHTLPHWYWTCPTLALRALLGFGIPHASDACCTNVTVANVNWSLQSSCCHPGRQHGSHSAWCGQCLECAALRYKQRPSLVEQLCCWIERVWLPRLHLQKAARAVCCRVVRLYCSVIVQCDYAVGVRVPAHPPVGPPVDLVAGTTSSCSDPHTAVRKTVPQCMQDSNRTS